MVDLLGCFASPSIFISLLLLLFLYYHFVFHSPTGKKNPCPESYPLIGNLIGFLRNRHRFHDWVADMLSTTPNLTLQANGFLGLFHIVCTADPANLRHLLLSNFPKFVKGSRFHSNFHEFLGNGIFNVDANLWFHQRKISSYEFNAKSLKKFISATVQSQLSNTFIPLLLSASNNREIIDLQDVLRNFTFGNICKVAFGVELNPQSNKNRPTLFVEAFDYAVEVSLERIMSPLPLVWKIKRFLNIGSERKYREAIGVIDEFAMNIIRLKEEEFEMKRGEGQDLLSRFMFSTSGFEFLGQDEKRKFLRDIIISFMLAGKDTTSTALTWFFWLMAGHPRCNERIYSELLAAAAVSPGIPSGNFGYDELKQLHYLHAALSESMRLFPPIPINSKLTLEDDVLPDGSHVHKGWFADYSAYAMGRMESLWGPDCKEYKPERWLDGDGVYQPSDQFKYPVFHGGPRLCLGKDMAYLQMKSVAAAVIFEFEVEAVDGGGCPARITDPPYSLSFVLKMRDGLRVQLKRRLRANKA